MRYWYSMALSQPIQARLLEANAAARIVMEFELIWIDGLSENGAPRNFNGCAHQFLNDCLKDVEGIPNFETHPYALLSKVWSSQHHEQEFSINGYISVPWLCLFVVSTNGYQAHNSFQFNINQSFSMGIVFVYVFFVTPMIPPVEWPST